MNERPNILLLMTDQQRFDTIAALGNPLIRTPTLDRLVNEGTAFTRAYTPSPVCVSARCSLVTGLPPHRTGCYNNMPMDHSLVSVMQILSEAGYQTHGVGKMHFLPDVNSLWGFESRDVGEEAGEDDFRRFVHQSGFEHVYDLHGVRSEYYYIPQPSQLPARLHHSSWVADRSIDFLAGRDHSRPFFLWSSWIKPHPPFDPPTPWNKLYRGPEMPLPLRPQDLMTLQTHWDRLQNRFKYRDQGLDDNLIRTMRAAYYACISFVDFNLGRVVRWLEHEGELDNTVVVFFSDHGEFLGDYDCFGKRSMLDASSRIPCLVRFPARFSPDSRCDTPVTLLDIMPTLLAFAEIKHSRTYGTNMSDIAAGNTTRDEVFSQLGHGRTGLYMVATRQYKYVYSAADDQQYLFDLRLDPRETRNLAGNPLYDSPERDLREALIAYFQSDGYFEPLEVNGWRKFSRSELPRSQPDAFLLFQDPPESDSQIPGYERDPRTRAISGNSARLLGATQTQATNSRAERAQRLAEASLAGDMRAIDHLLAEDVILNVQAGDVATLEALLADSVTPHDRPEPGRGKDSAVKWLARLRGLSGQFASALHWGPPIEENSILTLQAEFPEYAMLRSLTWTFSFAEDNRIRRLGLRIEVTL